MMERIIGELKPRLEAGALQAEESLTYRSNSPIAG